MLKRESLGFSHGKCQGLMSRSLPTFLAASLSAAHRLPFSECGARRDSARGIRASDVFLLKKSEPVCDTRGPWAF